MEDREIKTERKMKSFNASFIRLCISLAVLGAALSLRFFYPDQTHDFLQKTVTGGLDYTAVFGTVGDNLRSFFVRVPHPADEPETLPPESSQPAEPSPRLPPPDEAAGLGGFDLPVIRADARFLLSEFDGEDDTFPLPFGMQKPDKVDYTVRDLPFETTVPAAGTFSSAFGYRIHPVYGDWRFHYGIDISAPSGTPIAAFADGTVAAVGKSSGYGNYLIIEHEGGYFSLYAHCLNIHVKSGSDVKIGQEIAAVGSTGVSTGPHLHFELRHGSAYLDPALYTDV
jgi:murein DD-endopeptidase MepM/ murein hydrolase activator NlpD